MKILAILFCLLTGLVSMARAESDAWILNAGPTPHAWNPYGGVTREFGDGELRTFVTGGLGTILIGGGVAWYQNNDRTGLTAAATLGVVGSHVTVAEQFAIDPSRRWLVTAGVSYGMYFMQYQGFLPVLGVEHILE